MKTIGIRKAKAILSELVRDAAAGECSIVTDNRKPVTMVVPLPMAPVEAESPSPPVVETKPLSDAAAYGLLNPPRRGMGPGRRRPPR